MSRKRFKTVWDSNGIPELEYCRIERAAELLKCSKEDIYTLAEQDLISIGVRLPKIKVMSMVPESVTNILTDSSNYPPATPVDSPLRKRKKIKLGNIAEIDFKDSDKAADSDFYLHAYINGLWRLIPTFDKVGFFNESLYEFKGEYGVLMVKSFIDIPLGGGDESITPVFFLPITSQENNPNIKESSLYITKNDINAIYEKKFTARQDISSASAIYEDDIAEYISKFRTTANQATYIKFLLLLNGFNDSELKQSPQTLIRSISKKATDAGIEMPIISDNTMKDWLSRAREIEQLYLK